MSPNEIYTLTILTVIGLVIGYITIATIEKVGRECAEQERRYWEDVALRARKKAWKKRIEPKQ
jgi:hypothetical protein